MNQIKKYLPPVLLGLFGLLTVFMAGSVLFDLFGIRARQGNYVPFIVKTNFVAGILYWVAAAMWLRKNRNAARLLAWVAVGLIVAFIALQMHIRAGGLYEVRTVKAMIFRTTVTAVFAITAFFQLKNSTV